jgi:hypothetical protein
MNGRQFRRYNRTLACSNRFDEMSDEQKMFAYSRLYTLGANQTQNQVDLF